MAVLQCYNLEQTSKAIKIERHLFKTLRDTGLLTGRKSGRAWVFDEEEINNLVRMARGFDLGSEEKIRMNAPIMLTMNKEKKQ